MTLTPKVPACGLPREGLINSRFQQTSAENTGNLTDCRLKLRINQTFPRYPKYGGANLD